MAEEAPRQVMRESFSGFQALEEGFSAANKFRETHHLAEGAVANLVVCAGETALADSLLGALITSHPARIFQIIFGECRSSEIGVFEIPLRPGEEGEVRACEVCTLCIPYQEVDILPSVLHAYTLPGLPCELYIAHGKILPKSIEQLLKLTDKVLYDSDLYTGFREVLRPLRRGTQELIDLAWIRLSPWRQVIREAFDHPLAREILEHVSDIRVSHSSSQGELPTSSYLFAGWLLERLKLEPRAFGAGAFECLSRWRGQVPLALSLSLVPHQTEEGIHEVMFLHEDKVSRVHIRHGSFYEILIEGKVSYRQMRPATQLSFEDLLERYFLIGESTTNYRSSLSIAGQLSQLRGAFELPQTSYSHSQSI